MLTLTTFYPNCTLLWCPANKELFVPCPAFGLKFINAPQKVTWDISGSNFLVKDTHLLSEKQKKSKLWKIWVLSEKLSCLFYWLLLLFMDNRLLIWMVGIKLDKYETAPYFFLLNENLTCNFLLISVFLPKFDWISLIGTKNVIKR